ncbi:hypothetical protein GGR42_003297 [Saonia flava]|uniref:Uncharacterized protein n=1 Tax=Saonia flava TaxID=523696 RepID=A0A846QV48_9FLAO|nr:hypothetical protein [Saonia flava]NJB72806.1 hypothetical protein [Saonia flava]
MKSVELNPVGNFDPWEVSRLNELRKSYLSISLGQKLLFEDDCFKLWSINLYPGERLPFRIQNLNYSWACLNGGMAISRIANGCIKFFNLEKGDTGYFEFEGKNFICDFENVGEDVLELNAVEYKKNLNNKATKELAY